MIYTFRFREHHNHWVSAGALDEKYIEFYGKRTYFHCYVLYVDVSIMKPWNVY